MIRAIWSNGRFVPDDDVNLPEGTVVYVSREPLRESDAADLANQDDDPESVAAWLAWYDGLEPLVYAPGEEADIEGRRQQVADYSRQNMDRRIEGVFE